MYIYIYTHTQTQTDTRRHTHTHTHIILGRGDTGTTKSNFVTGQILIPRTSTRCLRASPRQPSSIQKWTRRRQKCRRNLPQTWWRSDKCTAVYIYGNIYIYTITYTYIGGGAIMRYAYRIHIWQYIHAYKYYLSYIFIHTYIHT